MAAIGKIARAMVAVAAVFVSGTAFAGNSTPTSPFEFDGGVRYRSSTGSSAKDLFDRTGRLLISRLIYGAFNSDAGDLFFRADHKAAGVFLKGNLVLGIIDPGHLTDEDFPPDTPPFFNTLSTQHGGDLSYATVDFGYDFLRKYHDRLGAFIGYNCDHEKLSAWGCTQQATYPVCIPSISSAVNVIRRTIRGIRCASVFPAERC